MKRFCVSLGIGTRFQSVAFLLCLFLALGGRAQVHAKGKAEHVVVVVWDGMRPDFIRPQYAPNLYALATNGVFFRRHHPVYISTTQVNGTALATGMHPGRSGVIANVEYRPEINSFANFSTEGFEAVVRGDLLTQGNYLRTPTVAEILQDNGIPTIIAGTKPVALLHDRSIRKHSQTEKESVTLFDGRTFPRATLETLTKVNDDKPFPTNVVHPNKEQDGWTTRSLVRALWKKGIPKYTLLWLSEPDKSQHEHGVGHPTALAGIESSDRNLGEVIKALNDHRVLDKTDIMVVSDHGFSTMHRSGPDVVDILKKQKFNATKKFENPEPGDVLVVGTGGSAIIYVMDRVESVIRGLVDFLQTTDFAGVICSRLHLEGTFPLEAIKYSSTNNAPDLVVSLRWNGDRNDNGAAGMFLSVEGTRNKGSHGSLSRFDMNNTLVASGPDFKKGLLNDVPSGNIDVAPTVLWLLGVKPPEPMDGRVLHEALVSNQAVPTPITRTLEAKRDLGYFQWRQYLKFTEVGHAVYFDEGNGEPTFKPLVDPD